MPARILIVDRNQAFAAMLEEMLTNEGGHAVQVASSAGDALSALQRDNFDLTILDMDLGEEGPDCASLVQRIRAVRPHMRLMLIPIMGADLPAEALQWDIQGSLSKPFFVDDLLPGIEEALSKTVRDRPQVKPEPPPAPKRVEAPAFETQRRGARPALAELARETAADAVLLLSTTQGAARIVEHISAWQEEDLRRFAALVQTMVESAQAAARFLGYPDEAFGHHMFEGDDRRLYIMRVSAGWLLVVATSTHIPLGTVRHNLRRTSRELAAGALT